ncbi:MAG TPA: signal peptidase II [Lachnospiraceae bacterium]|nr:signal peptidase II [Lachnospiraceae bacterium]
MLVLIDQLTKLQAVRMLKDKPAVPVIPGILELYYLPNGNTGAAFGILQGHKSLFLIISTIVIVLMLYFLYHIPATKRYSHLHILLVCIAAGGAGNMIDRIRLDYVIDFIYISAINFPVFNIADCYVSVSTVLLALLLLFYYKENDLSCLEKEIKKPFRKKNKEGD